MYLDVYFQQLEVTGQLLILKKSKIVSIKVVKHNAIKCPKVYLTEWQDII